MRQGIIKFPVIKGENMKYFLNAQGSAGDVRPMIALGMAMRDAGYEVIIGAPPNSSDLVTKYKLPFKPVGVDLQKFGEEQMHKANGNPVKYVEVLFTIMQTVISKIFDDLLEKAADCDYIISSGMDFAGYSVSEYHKIPWHFISHMPFGYQSKFYPPLSIKNQYYPYWMNRLLWFMQNFFLGGIIDGYVNKSRKKIKLGIIKNFTKKLVHNSILAADPLLVPMPSDIKDKYTQTGYFFLDDQDELDNKLEQFIKDGTPPIYLGFGSMPDTNPSKTSAIIHQLIRSNKYRFIISKGWAKLTSGEKLQNTYFVDNVPHAKLFPEMAVIIHHGGAGTTHTAARAGVPQIIVPHASDQYYYGNRIFKLKIGSKPIYRSRLTGNKLIAAIDEVMANTEIQNNAKEFGKHLADQNGIYEMINIYSRTTIPK
jgi:UDP:flavonoid glycosyltransferase YjiC (YdhE family)